MGNQVPNSPKKRTCLEAQEVSGAVPANGNLLAFQNGQWGPAAPGATGGGGNTLVFQPGANFGAGVVQNGNIFNSWPALMTAFAAMLALNDFVHVGFDGSLSPTPGVCIIPAGVWDFKGKAHLFNAGLPLSSALVASDVLLQAGAQFKSAASIDGLNIGNSPNHTLPALFWDTTVCFQCQFLNAPTFTNDPNSNQPFATFNGTTFIIEAFAGIGLTNGGATSGVIFALPAGATLGIALCEQGFVNTPTIGAAGFTSGAAGTTLAYTCDNSFGSVLLPQGASWLGTTTFTSKAFNSKTVAITANGNFTVPLGVTELDVEGCGGGGGGSGGNAGAAGAIEAGGGGGAGAPWQRRTLRGLTQLSVLAVVIGAGGAGGAAAAGAAGPSTPGGAGGQTTLGAGPLLAFDGGSGGAGTTAALVGGLGGMPIVGPALANVNDSVSTGATSPLFAGAGGKGGGGAAAPGIGARAGGLFAGGAVSANQANAASGGGGGAGPYGAGAAGGAATAAAGNPGAAAGANTGAGGGGGAGGNGAGNAGGAGGNGGSGVLFITWRLSP